MAEPYRQETCPYWIPPPSLVPANGLYTGWCNTAHPCVTADATFSGDERLLNFLRHAQRAEGYWKSYWWEDDEYATALAAEALARTGQAEDQQRVEAAICWASHRIAPDSRVSSTPPATFSAFVTDWCIRTLALADDPAQVRELIERAVDWLLERQTANGSWLPSARLRVPPLDAIDLETHPVPSMIFLDHAGIFTTATVLSALEAVRSHFSNS